MESRPTGRGSTRLLPMLVLGLGAALCLPQLAAAGPMARALDHLAAQQDPIGGGFGVDGTTDPGYTAWAALAVSAAGEDTARWRRGETSLRRALAGPLLDSTLGEVARTSVAIAAAGMDPRVVGGRNLVREVLRGQRTDGSIGTDPSTTAWGIMALAAAGLGPSSAAIRDASAALARSQREDGGWSLTDDVLESSGPNTTTAAIQALVAAGRDPAGSPALRRARAFLLAAQNPDGGFSPVVGGSSTALTTAWVTLAIRALGERPSRAPWNGSGGPLRVLAALQLPDGGVHNARASTETSVWATSQVALAYSGRYLPYNRLTRRAVPVRAPRVVSRRPLGGGRLTGPLVVRYRDDEGGTGVDPGSVRLRVDGEDLTSRALVTSSRIALPRRAVPAGPAVIGLRLADRAGNGRSVRWSIVSPTR